MRMQRDYWTVLEAVDQAADVWFSKELVDINAKLALSSTRILPTKSSFAPTNISTKSSIVQTDVLPSGARRFHKEVIKPGKTIIIKPRNILADDEWDSDPLPGEGNADMREPDRSRQIKEEVWLRLKNDLCLGKLQASAIPNRDTFPQVPEYSKATHIPLHFWKHEHLTTDVLKKPHPFGRSSRPHHVLISKEQLRKYLHPKEESIHAASTGSRGPVGHKPDALPPLKRAKEKELRAFLNTLGRCKEEDAWRAAEAHFGARITRQQFRDARTVKGKPGRPRKSHQEITP